MIAILEQTDGGLRLSEFSGHPPETIEHLGRTVGERWEPHRRVFQFVEHRIWAGAMAAYYREIDVDAAGE